MPAIKDATSEQLEAKRTALGLILERTVRSKVSFSKPLEQLRAEAFQRYCEIMASHEKMLDDLSFSLTVKLQDWAHPDTRIKLTWQADSSKVSISDPIAQALAGEGVFEGQIARFGHGFQRSFLLALLQELASGGDSTQPTLILACEEPELYQHPPQIRHMASVLAKLAEQGTQTLICTHSPLFIRGERFQEVRLVGKNSDAGATKVAHLTFDQLSDTIAKASGKKPVNLAGTALKVAQALQPTINEMFFTSVLVLVEGPEDAAYISTYLALTDRWQEFRWLGCHIVASQGKNSMIQPAAVAKGLAIPTFAVFDGDTDKCDRPDKKTMHEMDNRTLLNLFDLPKVDALPVNTVWEDMLVMWKHDVRSALAEDFGKVEWDTFCNAVKQRNDLGEVADIYKNSLFIQVLLSDAWDAGKRFPSLDKLTEAILKFAQTQVGTKKALTKQ